MELTKNILLLSLVFINNIFLGESICSSNTPCYPNPLDVSNIAQSTLNATSTCGTPAESFCSKADCTLVCDASVEAQKHPKSYMVDNFNLATYWKSKNLEAPVTIQLDLQQKLILHQVVTTFEIDVPSGVYLERSNDFGKTYGRLAYFAINCLSMFGLTQAAGYSTTNTICLRISTTDITTKTVSMWHRNMVWDEPACRVCIA